MIKSVLEINRTTTIGEAELFMDMQVYTTNLEYDAVSCGNRADRGRNQQLHGVVPSSHNEANPQRLVPDIWFIEHGQHTFGRRLWLDPVVKLHNGTLGIINR